MNRQGADEGTRYRTGIYWTDPEDKKIVEDTVTELGKAYDCPIMVEFMSLKNFYPAEDYHQDYLENNPDGYCHVSSWLFKMAKDAKYNKDKK